MSEMVGNQDGLAMVLAMSLVALLSVLGIWMIVESGNTYRMTQSVERNAVTFNLAEGALELSWQYLLEKSNEDLLRNVKDVRQQQEVTPTGIAYMASDQEVVPGHPESGMVTPVLIFEDSRVLPGWDISKFRGYYYRAEGKGVKPLPGSRGDAKTEVLRVVQKIGQVRPR
ncbi:hypothetical protein [Desulfoglaeba alkanexedens]|uniref:Type 4 fimbrial biogenesis protein PilX N-terminal domain-containing protein n=1 Tax=Desulfoglaeba alkanexedens ALDC TaxID=980445 RepID=A0A4P8L432_9BACT|nr:hypothetical protein [Desulfoglaeba alkanexedens]QCQ22658.1 hypothetical protein FDQ92_11055 [Desulfoglaeba alkanexedens ALDC]